MPATAIRAAAPGPRTRTCRAVASGARSSSRRAIGIRSAARRCTPRTDSRRRSASIDVDRDGAASLLRAPGYTADLLPFRDEHSLEIQLPFLQVIDPKLEIVPVLVGAGQDAPVLEVLAEGIRRVADEDTLVVVSSDFTHFGKAFGYLPFPADDPKEVADEAPPSRRHGDPADSRSRRDGPSPASSPKRR